MSSALDFQRALMKEEFDSIHNFGKDGKCSKCGMCCSDIIPVTDKELETLKRFVKVNKYKPNTRIKVGMVEGYDMTCPFLNDNGKCDVYKIRPEVCRLFKCYCENEIGIEHFRFYAKNPDVRSLRKEVFGQEVPF